MPYISVEVEVELDQFSDEELIEELRGRTSYGESVREIYDLLHMGKNEQAFAAMKTFICNETGRIL